jgi:hypothetical protein
VKTDARTIWKWVSSFFLLPHEFPRIGVELRREVADSLASEVDQLSIDADVAKLILDHTKNVADKTRDSTRTIEGKATTLAGFAATLIGLSISQNLALDNLRWSLIASDAFLFVSLCLAMWANTLRQASLPSAVIYNLPRTLRKENEGYIASALAESWYEYTSDLALFQGRKAVAVRLQFTAFFIGALLLAGSAVFAIAKPTPPPSPSPLGSQSGLPSLIGHPVAPSVHSTTSGKIKGMSDTEKPPAPGAQPSPASSSTSTPADQPVRATPRLSKTIESDRRGK